MTAPTAALDLSRTTVVLDFAAGWDADVVERVRAAGGEVIVVADEHGAVAQELAGPVASLVLTNPVDPATGTVIYPHDSRRCPCATCEMCKQAPIKDARDAGRSTVLVSDRLDDQKAALLADVVFATGPLAAWCRAFGVTYQPFASTSDIADALGA